MIGEVKSTEELQMRGLSWNTICGLACKALCMGLTFDQVAEQALREYIENSPYIGG